MDPSRQPGIQISQIFLERAEFSHVEDSLALPPNTPVGSPGMRLTTMAGVSPDGQRGIVRVRVQTKPKQRSLYNLDVEMTALVEVQAGNENMPIEQYIRTAGPAMLYTFVRQVVGDLTGRGRFGPLWLNPVNIVAASQEKVPAAVGEEVVAYGAPTRPPRLKRKTKSKK